MRLTKVEIDYYRSIEQAKLSLPENGPLVLFGPNNAGKSNLISAIHLFLGERWPATHELCDSDFYMRDKSNYPNAVITCSFDDTYYHRNSQDYRRISLRLSDDPSASMFFSEAEAVHNGGDGKLFINKDNRKAIQSFLVNAERNTAREFSYSSQYSLLSKFSHALHSSLCSEQKKSLNDAFESISGTFEGMDTYKSFSSPICIAGLAGGEVSFLSLASSDNSPDSAGSSGISLLGPAPMQPFRSCCFRYCGTPSRGRAIPGCRKP